MAYTDEELYLLAYVPQLIGSAVSSAAGSGLIGLGKEFFATASSVMEGAKTFPDNALIRHLSLILEPIVLKPSNKQRRCGIGPWRASKPEVSIQLKS